jgi:soluble lytic murein transglycosylase-like protein
MNPARRRNHGRAAYPRHPMGRARRRWPRAYDGGTRGPDNPRYRGSFRAERAREAIRRRTAFARLRENPVRNGLVGLAVAGAAAPLAVNRYQNALRVDDRHERHQDQAGGQEATSESVARVWGELQGAEAPDAREQAIRENMEKHRSYGLTRELAETIYDAAVENEVDPATAFGLIRAESSFRNSATSPVGAVGLAQLMPRTADWMQPGVTRAELRNPDTNVRIGFKYLRYLLDKYDEDERLALLAYNRGPGTVDRAIRTGANPDNGYADFVHGREGHGHTLYTR